MREYIWTISHHTSLKPANDLFYKLKVQGSCGDELESQEVSTYVELECHLVSKNRPKSQRISTDDLKGKKRLVDKLKGR